MTHVKNLLYVDADESRSTDIEDYLPQHWSMQSYSELLPDPKTVAELEVEDVVDVIVLTDTVLQAPKNEIRNTLDAIHSVSETTPIIFYGTQFTDKTYKLAYNYDIVSVTTPAAQCMKTGEFTNLHDDIATASAVTTVDLQDTTFSVAQSLMGAADDELDMKIEWALESLGETLGAVQCLIYDVSTSGENIVKTYSWENVEEYESQLNTQCDRVSSIGDETITEDSFPGYEDVLATFSPVCYNEYCDEITEEFTREKGTLLAIPIVIDWELHSIFTIRTAVPQYWTDEVRTQLESIAELIVHTNRRREQRVELQRQNQQLEQFNSVISHDLQNPLSVAKGYVELVQDTGNLSELDTAADAIVRMEEMINELLALARQGEEIGETEPYSLREILRDAESHVTIPNGHIDMSGVPDDEVLVCDSSRVRELFENLFRNAVDHCGDDVAVTVTVTDDGEIVVGDDGPGIPPEKREEIFEHGYTGADGTGFGLAIVKRVVDAHGWRIEVGESDAGGAAFVINPV